MVLVSSAGLFVVSALCVFVLQQMLRTPYVSVPVVCATEDCVMHARHILRTLDVSANPCLSFHAYVCGAGSGDASNDVQATTAPSTKGASNYTGEAGDGLLRHIDPARRFHDYDGASTASTWWEREDSSAQCRFDKARSAHEARAIGDLFALDVALAAMKRVSDASPLRLKLLEKLTATQTFYVSYCSRFCGDPDAREKCDLAMNGSEFLAAFDCQWQMFDRGCLFV
ncbi:uncharacterized protein [Dermacentor andersoni]|uniref:uncharacterized protein n=1 Tax=Dermacentor andersoni TaxID=34620 RepID=UPI002415D366|nr:uncharacterized protein LOC129383324 [Dermacentor andersoni]XP_054923722.1 uncharacterized protein LOC129383324 [Dermacentor andersoni]XP_054923723.1 uncharacterized protein LOC129383324 [Dermacentor andersoni]